MPKVSTTAAQAREIDVESYVEERYQFLAIPDDPHALFREAKKLQRRIEQHRILTLAAKPLGVIAAVIGFGVFLDALISYTLDVPTTLSVMAFLATSWLLISFGFKAETKARLGVSRWSPRYPPEHYGVFCRVFEPVKTGQVRLALLSQTGTGANFTPVTDRPIERYLAQDAFTDLWLPAELLQERREDLSTGSPFPDTKPQYVLIEHLEATEVPSPRSKGWKQYYLWHLSPGEVEQFFNQAGAIYPDKKVERVKAQVAVVMVCEHFEHCRMQGMPIGSQSQMVRRLETRLKYEANRRLASRTVTELESQRLARLNLSGELKTVDPSELRAALGDKPESWFLQLLSGDNETILPHLRAEALKVRPELPVFHDS
jgi:hypothetical protein